MRAAFATRIARRFTKNTTTIREAVKTWRCFMAASNMDAYRHETPHAFGRADKIIRLPEAIR